MMGKDVVNAPAAGNRYLVLIGAIVVQLILGTVYGYSIFWAPLQAEVYPPVVAESSLVTWDMLSDRVVTDAEAQARKEAGKSNEGYIIVKDDAEKVSKKELISKREAIAGFTVFESQEQLQSAVEKGRAGEAVDGKVVAKDAKAAADLRTEQTGYLKYAFSVCIFSFAITMVLAGRVQDVKGPRFPAIIGAVLMGVGFLLAGMMRSAGVFLLAHAAMIGAATIVVLMLYHALLGKVDTEKNPSLKYVPMGIVAMMVVAGVVLGNRFVGADAQIDRLLLLWGTIGFLAGAGIGFAYVCPIAALVKWFPDKKGLVSGIAVAGFGFGAYLFKGREIGALRFIEEYGILDLFIVHGLVCIVGVTAGALLLRNPPGIVATKAAPTADSGWQDTVKRPAFYVLWLMFFSGAMAGLMVISIVKGFVEGQAKAGGFNAVDAAAIGAAALGGLAIFNAVGRVVWGFVSDWIGRTSAFVLMFALQAVVLFALGGLKGEWMLYVATAAVGFNFGGNFALFPSATADLFGAKNLGANYGWVFTSYGVAGIVGVMAGNMAKEQTGSFYAAFALAAVLCVVSAGLAVGLKLMGKKKQDQAVAAAPAAAGSD
jgi:OFA family oxalate/formate antiporter-like MFS transporter